MNLLRVSASLLIISSLLIGQAPAPAKAPEPPKDKPFADIVKDAQVIPGLFTVYRTEEKVFLEILPDQLEKNYIAALTQESGLAERGFYAAQMGGALLFYFHKQGKNIQMIARNSRFQAEAGTPIRRALDRSFSDSILGMTKIESLPHPERKSLLIDLGAILLTDLPLLSYDLEATFRIPYRFDAKNSAFGWIKSFPKNTELEVISHYAADRPPLPPLLAPGATPPPTPPPPRTLVDVRSMLFRLRYSLTELPSTGYRPRLADDRVGHFLQQIEDYTTDARYSPAKRYINRWHLEKSDPAAPLSRPKQPIVYWLENTIPVKYRAAIRDGVLLWNKAFEKIGFQDAIEVRQQHDTPDWDPGDVRYATIRWFINTDSAFAIGPSYADPSTGQIYDADVGFSESMTRFFRREYSENVAPVGEGWMDRPPSVSPFRQSPGTLMCDLGQGAVADATFGFDLLLSRGMDPEGPEAEEFVRQYLVEIAAHEVGHTLGLRHNFRASAIHTLDKLNDKQFTGTQGLTASVMDYIPTNLSADAAKQGHYHQVTLGPYDYWAIEYAYKPINAATPEAERPELAKIASRAAEPLLAYATDEDAGFSSTPYDMDPSVNRFDLGSEPLKYFMHRTKLAQETWKNMESRLEKPGEGYQILRRSFGSAFGQYAQGMTMAARYIGGVYHYREHAGDPSGRLPYQPAPALQQRAALDLLRNNLFSSKTFNFSPKLLNKLASERFSDFRAPGFGQVRMDYPVHAQILSLQAAVLNRVMHPVVLSRLLDSEVKSDSPLTISSLFSGLQESIWEETKAPAGSVAINSYRRSLQRDHLRRLVAMVLQGGGVPEDARTMARASLNSLRSQINGALRNQGVKMSVEARAHLSESVERIDQALKAQAARTAF